MPKTVPVRRVVAALAISVACSAPAAFAENPTSAAPRTFSLDEIRRASPVRTYKFERAYYEHLTEVARRLATSRGELMASAPEIRGIVPPERPHITIELGDAPTTGNAGADIRLVVVESLSQVFAQRLDRSLATLRERYGRRLAITYLPFVIEGRPAALEVARAAHCAHAEGVFTGYRRRVLVDVSAQTSADLVAYAKESGADVGSFRSCLASEDSAAAVLAATERVRRTGISIPPVVLVNGIYVEGAEQAEKLFAVVAAEAGERGLDVGSIPTSDLPWRLRGVMLAPGQAPQALLVAVDDASAAEEPRTLRVTVGDRLGDDATVTEILTDVMLVRRADRLEKLTLSVAPAAPVSVDGARATDRALVTGTVVTVAVDESTLRLIARLRPELERQLGPTDLVLDGHRMLKLSGEEHTDVLARVGLEPGDGLMRVNDEWVYEGRNTLFEAIGHGLPVTVVVMRKGFPRLIELKTP